VSESVQDSVSFEWAEVGRIGLDEQGKLGFPSLPREPGVNKLAIHVSTLVIHRDGDAILLTRQARYVADQIPGTTYVELPGVDHVAFIGDADPILDEIERFVTGRQPTPDLDKVLATVLFTDIVDSTQRRAEIGDRAQTVKDLVAGSSPVFQDAREHELTGVPDRCRLYRVFDG
jgi:hypothetical protein